MLWVPRRHLGCSETSLKERRSHRSYSFHCTNCNRSLNLDAMIPVALLPPFLSRSPFPLSLSLWLPQPLFFFFLYTRLSVVSMRSIAVLRALVGLGVGDGTAHHTCTASKPIRDDAPRTESSSAASASGLHRTRRDARVAQNLPLRRRCLFLLDSTFLQECFTPRDAVAANRISGTREILQSFARDVTVVQQSSTEDLVQTAQKMCHAVSPSTTTPSSSPTAASLAVWAEGVETLLTYLEEAPEPSSSPTPTTSSGNSAAPLSASAGKQDHVSDASLTSTETAVRTLLCDLVKHLYGAGAAFYERQRSQARSTTTRAAALARKRRRSAEEAEGGTTYTTVASLATQQSPPAMMEGGFPMRVTWSVAGPVAASLQELYRCS